MPLYSVAPWSDLFAASAAAAAALTGLLFVAVSINIKQILDPNNPGLPQRALQTLLVLLGLTVVSLLGLEPDLSSNSFGIELLVAGAVLLVTVIGLIRSSVKAARPGEPLYLGSQLATSMPAIVPFLIGGVSLLAASGGGLNWVIAGIVGGLIGTVVNAWVLLGAWVSNAVRPVLDNSCTRAGGSRWRRRRRSNW